MNGLLSGFCIFFTFQSLKRLQEKPDKHPEKRYLKSGFKDLWICGVFFAFGGGPVLPFCQDEASLKRQQLVRAAFQAAESGGKCLDEGPA